MTTAKLKRLRALLWAYYHQQIQSGKEESLGPIDVVYRLVDGDLEQASAKAVCLD